MSRTVSVATIGSLKCISCTCHKCLYYVAGEVLEQAVFLSIKLKDEAAFERNFFQLQAYYTDTRCALTFLLLSAAFRLCYHITERPLHGL